jgi:hypothetical protein
MRGNHGRGAITNQDQPPKTLAGMEDYFLSGRPKLDSGTIYNCVKIAFNGDEHTFWQDVQQPLKRVNVQIYRDALPHEPYVTVKVMIKNSHPCWNTIEWNSFLIQQMEITQANEGGHQHEVVVAFIDKPIMDGNKCGTNKKLNQINRKIYVQIPKGDEVRIQCLLDTVLKGEAILLCSHIPMCMVSKQSKFHSSSTCLQINKALKQHRQMRHSLTDVTIDIIDDIDTPLPYYDGKTLQTLMMKISRQDNLAEFAILAVDSKGPWQTGSDIRITVATKYEETCLPVAKHITAYLLCEYDNDVLQYLSPSAQGEALETVWDP